MQDRQLYEQILGIAAPWRVERVELSLDEGEVQHRRGRHRPARPSQDDGLSRTLV